MRRKQTVRTGAVSIDWSAVVGRPVECPVFGKSAYTSAYTNA